MRFKYPDYGWPHGPTYWREGRTLYISIPFTWNLPMVRDIADQRDMFCDHLVVGGPAVGLMPDYLADLGCVEFGGSTPGVLQRASRYATKTTTGCVRRCGFCGVPRLEGGIVELEEWPDLPLICDNNLLAASEQHFMRVIERLWGHEWCDFNQGMDARLLTDSHAALLRTLHRPIIRLALDTTGVTNEWERAYDRLLSSRIPKSWIRSYVLCGFGDTPEDAWHRCSFVEHLGVLPNPQWFHKLNTLEYNSVTEEQEDMGWSEAERQALLGFFYQRRGERKYT